MEKADLEILFDIQKGFFRSGKTRDIDFRIASLTKLKSTIKKQEKEILAAIYSDLHKAVTDAYATEIAGVYAEIDFAIKNIRTWSKRKKVETPIFLFPSKSYIYKEPYGVVLIIAPWNYPFQLLMIPLVGAIAAGNTAILKPSEISSHTAAVLEKVINNAFPREYLRVIQGAAQETKALLELPVDCIFFTGSTAVGKIVMTAAAHNLTPVTLELGGKSPAIVHESANLITAARRICWGKFINAGQTCIAPDYVIVHESIKEAFLSELKNVIVAFYGEDASSHPRYCRIINDRHFQRLTALIDKGKVVYGGKIDSADRYIEPTIFYPASWNEPIMQDEIFGPILPIITYSDLNDVISKINNRPKPLSLYLFTEDKIIRRRIINEISFGGGAINNTIMHFISPFLPFGGVGASGMGKYHGKYSFDTFSHFKSILKSLSIADPVALAYPNKTFFMKIINKIMG
jgi:aldehyde dehydrogenase (NAD+)